MESEVPDADEMLPFATEIQHNNSGRERYSIDYDRRKPITHSGTLDPD
jgi:hypothetical protein